MSETPRTDDMCGCVCSVDDIQQVPADFARQLERELAAARAQVAGLERIAKGMTFERVLKLEAERDALRADAERWLAVRNMEAGPWAISRWDRPAQGWVHVYGTAADAAIDRERKA